MVPQQKKTPPVAIIEERMLHRELPVMETVQSALGILSVVSTHLQLALSRVSQEDRVTRDYIETGLAMLDGSQRSLAQLCRAAERQQEQHQQQGLKRA